MFIENCEKLWKTNQEKLMYDLQISSNSCWRLLSAATCGSSHHCSLGIGLFSIIELSDIKHQKDDAAFAQLLIQIKKEDITRQQQR